MNPFNKGYVNPDPDDDYIIFTEMKSHDPRPEWLTESYVPDVQHYLLFSFNRIDDSKYNVPSLYPCYDGNGTELRKI